MALLERVSTLVRANLNDLIDKAEEPEKMIKQVILDMHNQLLQVKTQVAIAIADQHLLEKKKLENDDKIQEWMRKAELAVDKQHEDQKAQVENLKSALRNLDQKLAEANAKADLLIAQHRRARAANRTTDAQSGMSANTKSATFDRMKKKVAREEAIGGAKAQLLADDVEDRLAALEKEDRIEQLLTELKTKRGA